MSGEPKTSKRKVKAKARELQALELRKTGFTYDEIAMSLGYAGRDAAYKAVVRAIEKVSVSTREEAPHVLALELARLDKVLKPMMKKAEGGRCDAVDRVLRIAERRARLLGLDTPTKMAHEVEVDAQIEHEIQRLTDEDRAERIRAILEKAKRREEEAKKAKEGLGGGIKNES